MTWKLSTLPMLAAIVVACGGDVKTEPPRHVAPNGHGGAVPTRMVTGGLSSGGGGASASGAGGIMNPCAPVPYPVEVSVIDMARCAFEIPTAADGTRLDPGGLAVTYTPQSTGLEWQIPKLNGGNDCALDQDKGWYFDDVTAPTKIEMCAGTCAEFSSSVVRLESNPCGLPGERLK